MSDKRLKNWLYRINLQVVFVYTYIMSEFEQQKTRERSPSYPYIGLEQAIALVEKIYLQQKRSLVYAQAAMESIGYEPKGSTAGRILAALVSYGLVEGEGVKESRKIRVSANGQRLVILDKSSAEWLECARQAARSPKIFSDLFELWSDGLPSDAAIKQFLILEKRFNDNYVSAFIKNFRDTYEFARITEGSTGDDFAEETPVLQAGLAEVPRHQADPVSDVDLADTLTININRLVVPLNDGRCAELRYPSGLSAADFEDIKEYLDTFLKVQSRRLRVKHDEGE